MEKWKNRKWLVNSWIALSIITAIIYLTSPSIFNGVLFALVLLATVSARKRYKNAISSVENKEAKIEVASTKQPSQSTQPIQPIENAQTKEVVAPAHINETIQPTQSVQTVEITKPIKPIQTTEQTPYTNTVQPVQSEKPKEDFDIFTFNVAGTTMKNDNKKDIQKLLKRNGKLYCEEQGIELFSGYSNKEIIDYVFNVSEFEDLNFDDDEISFAPEPTNEYDPNAIKVFLEFSSEGEHHVGYVPKKSTKELRNILDTKDIISVTAQYVGGKIKESEFDWEKDKEVVVTKELTLGVEIAIRYKV